MLPNQNIPDNEKTEDWAKKTALAIVRSSTFNQQHKEQIRFCQRFHQGDVNQSDWDYLRKVGEFELPAFVRHIPLLKPMFEALKTDESKRPFKYRVYTIDKESITKKKDHQKMRFMQMIDEKLKSQLEALTDIYEQIQMQEQQIAEAQETGEQVDPNILKQLQKQKSILEKPISFSQKEIDDFQMYYKISHKDTLEILSQKGAEYLYNALEIKKKFNEGMEDVIVSDTEIYFIECVDNKPDPIFELIDPAHFDYSFDDVDWIHQCQWGCYRRLMTPNAILGRWNPKDKETIDKIFYNTTNSLSFHSNYFHNNSTGPNNSDLLRTNSNVVAHVYWMCPKQFYFYEIVDEEGNIKQEFSSNKSEVPPGIEYELRFLDERWEAVIIDDSLVLHAKRSEYQMYDTNWNHHGLPFIGQNKWGRKKSASLVWQTKDIQIMYNLVHYHKELWLALSGVKGFIMDKGQIPDDMEPEEWMFQRKMGVAWIERIKKDKRVDTSFNQFQSYDDTVSPAIQYLLKILEHYEQLAYKVTGISPQSLGQIAPGELVGSVQAANTNSNRVIEIMFVEHEITKRMVMSKLINACRISWSKGRELSFINTDLMAQEILTVSPKQFQQADYDVFVLDAGKEQSTINSLQQMAMQKHAQNVFDIPQMAKIITTDSVKELEALLEKYSDVAMERAQQSQQSEQEQEQTMKKMEQDFLMAMQNQKLSLEQARLEIDKEKLSFDIEQANSKLESEAQLAREKINQDKYSVDVERDTEMRYLEFEKTKAVYDAEINKLKIQFDAINNQLNNISKEKQKEKVKD